MNLSKNRLLKFNVGDKLLKGYILIKIQFLCLHHPYNICLVLSIGTSIFVRKLIYGFFLSL